MDPQFNEPGNTTDRTSDANECWSGADSTNITVAGFVSAPEISEEHALRLAWHVVDQAGGTRAIYRNPKYAYSLQQTADLVVDGIPVELRHGEISSPAIVTVAGWVF